jgi:hypothetical protein
VVDDREVCEMADEQPTSGSGKVTGPASYFPSIEKKYGRPIDEWLQLVRDSDLPGYRERVEWLKADHGLGHGHANAIVAHVTANPT